MAVRSRHVVATRWNPPPSTAVQTLYTVPADRTLILKDWRAHLLTGTGTLTVYIEAASGGGANILGSATSGVAIGEGPAECARVLQEGDHIRAVRSVADGITDFWFSGSLLDGDPS